MTGSNEKSLLVTCIDHHFVQHAQQLFSGAWRYGEWRGDTLLLHRDLPAADLRWFTDRGVRTRRADPYISREVWLQRVAAGRFPPVVADRWVLFGPDFREWDLIVYLDSDIIVNGDLRPLMNVRRFGAVADLGHLVIDQFRTPGAAYRSATTNNDVARLLWRRSFNCGVFAFRPRTFPEDFHLTLRDSVSALLPEGRFADQLGINVAIQRWEHLPLRLNLCPRRPHFGGHMLTPLLPMRPSRRGLIYHYYGDLKPWMPGHPHQELWSLRLREAESRHYEVRTGVAPRQAPLFLDAVLTVHHLALLLAMRLRRAVRSLLRV